MTKENEPKKKKVIVCGGGGNAAEIGKALIELKAKYPEYEIVTETDATASMSGVGMFKEPIEIPTIKLHEGCIGLPDTRAERRAKARKKKQN